MTSERRSVVITGASAPYGLGVTILLAGTYDTELTHDGAAVYRDDLGPYGVQRPRMEKRGRAAVRLANSPERFARSLARALERDRQPIAHRGAGVDAKRYRARAPHADDGDASHDQNRVGATEVRCSEEHAQRGFEQWCLKSLESIESFTWARG